MTDDNVVEESTSTWFFVARDPGPGEPDIPYVWVGCPHRTEGEAREAAKQMAETAGVDGCYPIKVTETRRVERV